MLRNTTLLLIATLLLTCQSEQGVTVPVEYAGALKNIMRKGDLSAQFNLADLGDQQHLFALGALAELKGEILVMDGQAYISSEEDEKVKIDSTLNHEATLLVYSEVKEWLAVDIPAAMQSKDDLEAFVEEQAMLNGINSDQPFPFRMEGVLRSFDWHVINWPEGDKEHSHEKHISSGPHGTLANTAAEVLGFYSKHHHAIFTHHTTNMHLHVRTMDGQLAGHLDDLELGEGMKLLLPVVPAVD